MFRYLAYDLRTNTLREELPLVSPRFGGALSGTGTFQADLALDVEAQVSLGTFRSRSSDLWAACTPGRTVIYVEADGVLLPDAFIVWTRRYSSERRVAQLGGQSLFSYFDRRRISDTLTFTGTDQLSIARQLINWAQLRPGGNINVAVGTELDGVLRDRTYWSYERKKVGEAIRQLASVDNGFDFALEVAYSPSGFPTRSFRLGTRGRTAESSGHVFEHGRNLVEYSITEDAAGQANRIYGEGAGDGPTMLVATADRTDVLTAGWPLLEDVAAYKDVTVQSTLQGHAKAIVDSRAFPIEITSATVRADGDPQLGEWIVGDYARFVFGAHPTTRDPVFPTRTELVRRIVGYEVNPDTLTVDLVLND